MQNNAMQMKLHWASNIFGQPIFVLANFMKMSPVAISIYLPLQ